MRNHVFGSVFANKKSATNRRLDLNVGLFSLTALSLFLSACGGGGGGSDPDPNPTPDNKAPEFSPAVPATGVEVDENDKSKVILSENIGELGTFAATDGDGDVITYSLKGDDAALFEISDKGVLTFVTAPDYETLSDKVKESGYKVTITATDKAGAKAEHALTITVRDDNDAPEFADDVAETASVAESVRSVGTYLATDDDVGDTVTYSLKGDDADKFAISASGVLSFLTDTDYDNPGSKAGTNVYKVTIVASSGAGDRVKTTEHALEVTVTDENEAPRFADDVAKTASVAENVLSVGAYTATDEDRGDSITYSLKDGQDSALFDINDATGELTFKTAPDHETPKDGNTDNVYKVTIVATDKAGAKAEHALEVTVTDENEAPEFAADVAKTTSVAENTAITTVLGTFTATDEDAGDTVTYSLAGDDASKFTIDSATGRLNFRDVPNFEAAQDIDGNNVYEITIVATGGTGDREMTAEHAFTVTVTDVEEGSSSNKPKFADGLSRTKSVAENTNIIGQFTATDADQDDTITYSLDGADKALFDIDSEGNLVFRTAPNFEDAKDADEDNVYKVKVVATDRVGNHAEHEIDVTVTNANDAPRFAHDLDVERVIDENIIDVGTFEATDEDEVDRITYSLKNGQDSALFDIDDDTGELTFKTAPDHENANDVGTNNVYEVTVVATDNKGAATEQYLTVTVKDVNEAPKFASPTGTADVNENQTAVGTYTATDEDRDDSITYSLKDGQDSALFDINDDTGELTFKTAPDHETPKDGNTDNVYNVTIVATDSKGAKAEHALAVTVVNENDNAPSFAGVATTASVAENVKSVGTFVATDEDEGDTITYDLKDGQDSALFDINDDTGELTFKTAPDYEIPKDGNTDNVYNVTIVATDNAGATGEHELTVTVTDENDNTPEFVAVLSDKASVVENTREVGTFTATDDDKGDTIAYSLQGDDADLFEINSATGALSFIDAPDYETPGSSAEPKSNVYNVTIVATDNAGATDTHALTVTVINENETPIFDTNVSSVDIPEVVTKSVGTFSATSISKVAIIYTVEGNDKDLFSIDSATGELTFNTAPDYESLTDSVKTNGYSISIKATAGGESSERALTVKVLDLNEVASGSSGNDYLSGTDNAETLSGGEGSDYIYGRGGDDRLLGGEDNDWVDGGEGNDRLLGDDGNDSLYGGDGEDNIAGGAGDDYISGGVARDILSGEAGNDRIDGGEGNDNIQGGEGDDSIDGGAGNDLINGSEGNDYISGGKGDDTIDDGDGDDIYFYKGGDGKDVISDFAGADTIRFDDIDIRSIVLEFSGDDLLIKFRDKTNPDTISTTDMITVNGGKTTGKTGGRIEKLQIGEAVYDISDMTEFHKGSSGADTLDGTTGVDWLSGGGGNDVLKGEAGNDILIGGTGDDNIQGGDGDDFLFGGADNDSLLGGDGDDLYYYKRGDGNDTITDSSGNDSIIFSDIEVTDIVVEFSDSKDDMIIKFKEGDAGELSSSDMITIDNVATNRIEKFQVGGITYDVSSISSGGGLAGNDWLSGGSGSDTVKGGDGDDVIVGGKGMDNLNGEAGDDQIYGGDDSDVLFGGEGDDKVFGGEGHDFINGDAGIDTLYGNDGQDTIDGGADNDHLFGNMGDDHLIGRAGDDNLFGGEGNDSLFGGEGDDFYHFEMGDGKDEIADIGGSEDVIKFDGIDLVSLLELLVLEVSGTDLKFKFRESANSDDISSSDSITIKDGLTDAKRIEGFMVGDEIYYNIRGITAASTGTKGKDSLVGTTGSDFMSGYEESDTLQGEGGDDFIIGGVGDDDLQGGEGNDLIDGGIGDDVIQGGAGNDTMQSGLGDDDLQGGAGNDFYFFTTSDGNDDITDSGGVADVIAIEDVSIESIVLEVSGDNILIKFRENHNSDTILTTGSIKVNNGNTDAGRIEFFHIGGVSYNVSGVKSAKTGTKTDSKETLTGTGDVDWISGGAGIDSISGGDGDDFLFGGADNDNLLGGNGDDMLYGGDGKDVVFGHAGNDYLYGGAGDDQIFGDDSTSDGNDILEGGAGNDTLNGGGGDDAYYFSIHPDHGEGHDIINETGTTDNNTIRLGTFSFQEIDTTKATFALSGSDLKISYGSDISITVKEWESAKSIDKLEYFDSSETLQTFEKFDEQIFTTTAKTLKDILSASSDDDGFDEVSHEDVDLLGLHQLDSSDLF